MTHYTEWRIWNGGPCPMGVGTMGQVQLRSEARGMAEGDDVYQIGDLEWQHDGLGNDIIAYRVAIPAPKPRTFWIVDGDAYESEAEANRVAAETGVHDVIKAQEVL